MDIMKYKDKRPETTVEEIIGILNEKEIKTHLEWFSDGVFGCISNRVTIEGTTIGTNGKGIGRAFAEASAYAELMERIQNDMTYLGKHDPAILRHEEVWNAFDEKIQSADQVIHEDNAFYTLFFNKQGCCSPDDKQSVLKRWDFKMTGRDDEYVCVPFVSIKNQEIQYLPIGICQLIYASNGMCAGNTAEEALVQGLSEIFERYVCRTIIHEKITPPDIPDDFLSRYEELYRIIESIRKQGRYKVLVKDCSLGKRYPVTAVIIIDQEKGTFGVKFASHPVFSIALERSLSEAFQGKSLEEFVSLNRIGSPEQLIHRDNILNIFKTGTGYYPAELFAHSYSYPFVVPEECTEISNKAMLKELVQTVLKNRGDVLVRDASFLGFHSYYVIIPGISEMFEMDYLRAKEQHTFLYISKILNGLPDASTDELELLINMILFKYNSIIENQIGVILGRPFQNGLPGGDYATQFLLFVCLYRLGRNEEALDVIKSIKYAVQETERKYFSAITSLVKFRINGFDKYTCLALLIELYGQDMGERVFYQLVPHENVISNLYPKFNCWDCEHCEASDLCCYPEVARLHKKLREEAVRAGISQERLLCRLQGLGLAEGSKWN